MKISSLPPTFQGLPPKAKGMADPVDRFVSSFPGLSDLNGPKIVMGCVGAFMGAIPMAGAAVNALGGLLSNGTPEGTGMVGMLANMGGDTCSVFGPPRDWQCGTGGLGHHRFPLLYR